MNINACLISQGTARHPLTADEVIWALLIKIWAGFSHQNLGRFWALQILQILRPGTEQSNSIIGVVSVACTILQTRVLFER